jgi:hypothetical protein
MDVRLAGSLLFARAYARTLTSRKHDAGGSKVAAVLTRY